MKTQIAILEKIDYTLPMKSKRRCANCPTLLREGNKSSLCSVCQRRQDARNREEWHIGGFRGQLLRSEAIRKCPDCSRAMNRVIRLCGSRKPVSPLRFVCKCGRMVKG